MYVGPHSPNFPFTQFFADRTVIRVKGNSRVKKRSRSTPAIEVTGFSYSYEQNYDEHATATHNKSL